MENNTDPSKWPLNEYFKIPEFFSSYFTIELLGPQHLHEDYAAFMSSVDIINETRNDDWPSSEFTLEENSDDMYWHQEENEKRRSIAFVVRDLNSKYVGRFYFYPIGVINKNINPPLNSDVDVSWWVTQEAFDRDLYDKLYFDIKNYLKSWPFNGPWFSNKIIPT